VKDHEERELLHTLAGLRDMLKDILFTDGEPLLVRIARLEEKLRGHGKLILALGAAIGAVAGAIAVLAD